MEHKRNNKCHHVLKVGSITFSGSGVDCLVRNISNTGASLEVENPIDIPTISDLAIVADHSTERCHFVWRKRERIGVVFDAVDPPLSQILTNCRSHGGK